MRGRAVLLVICQAGRSTEHDKHRHRYSSDRRCYSLRTRSVWVGLWHFPLSLFFFFVDSGKARALHTPPASLATSNYYPDPNISSNHKLLQIALPASTNISSFGDEEEDLKKRLRIRSVYIKEPSLVIERAYTPLYDTLPGSNSKWLASATAEERRLLDLLVKKYPDGELGRMLHRARPNPIVPQLETRGPVDTWSFERDSSTPVAQLPDRIVMVVGGTGITPAYQLLTNLFGRPATAQAGKAPKIDVLYATPDIDNALLLPQLHALAEANKDKVSISLFAERLPSSFTSPTSAAALGPLTPLVATHLVHGSLSSAPSVLAERPSSPSSLPPPPLQPPQSRSTNRASRSSTSNEPSPSQNDELTHRNELSFSSADPMDARCARRSESAQRTDARSSAWRTHQDGGQAGKRVQALKSCHSPPSHSYTIHTMSTISAYVLCIVCWVRKAYTSCIRDMVIIVQ